MLTKEQEKKIFESLKANFVRDVNYSVLNLLKKSAQDIKSEVGKLLSIKDEDEIAEIKKWVDELVKVVAEDLSNDVEKYFNNFNFD